MDLRDGEDSTVLAHKHVRVREDSVTSRCLRQNTLTQELPKMKAVYRISVVVSVGHSQNPHPPTIIGNTQIRTAWETLI